MMNPIVKTTVFRLAKVNADQSMISQSDSNSIAMGVITGTTGSAGSYGKPGESFQYLLVLLISNNYQFDSVCQVTCIFYILCRGMSLC